jgi:hypothetical protein
MKVNHRKVVVQIRKNDKNNDIIREEFATKSMRPKRLERWLDLGGNPDDF